LLEFLSRLFLFVLLAVEPVLLVLCIVSLCVRGEQTLHRADFSLFVDQILGRFSVQFFSLDFLFRL
jgi:hypothetical protein